MRPTPSDTAPWLICAGEVSGDIYGAGLIQALKQRAPELRLLGLGGPLMQAAGLTLLADLREHSAIGVSENLRSLPFFYGVWQRLRTWLRQIRPQAVVLIDFQGLNLKLAEEASALGLPVYYLMAPQDWIWGWAAGTRRITRQVQTFLTVFQPEADFYRAQGAQVYPIGHPLLDLLPQLSRAQARKALGLSPDQTLICWMPGSRLHEVRRLSPILQRIQAELPTNWGHILPLAAPFLAPALQGLQAQQVNLSERYLAMLAADLVLGASGNMVLEAALLGRPVLALYQVSALTYAVARRLVRSPWVSLPNLLLNERVVPEFIQHFPLDILLQTLDAERQASEKWLHIQQRLQAELGPQGALERAARYLLRQNQEFRTC